MGYITKNLRQSATFWATTGLDNFGDPTWAAPVAISVRWEIRREIFLDSSGEENTGESVVYLDRDVARGDYLFLGTSVTADPTTVTDSRLVRDFRKSPDIRGDRFERLAVV